MQFVFERAIALAKSRGGKSFTSLTVNVAMFVELQYFMHLM